MKHGALFIIACSLPLLGAAPSVPASDEPIFRAMHEELARTTKDLHLSSASAPYYVAYWVADVDERSVEATLGVLVSDSVTKDRFAKVELRVGTRASDNSNFEGGGAADGGDFMKEAELLAPRPVPIEDGVVELRHELWLATDAAYKGAIETIEKKRATKESEVAARAEVASFSADTSAVLVVPDEPIVDRDDPRDVARRVSAVFRTFPEIQKSEVHLLETNARRRFVASDGGLVLEPSRFAGIEVSGETQAADGMSLQRSALVAAGKNVPLPVDAALAAARSIATDLVELRTAKVAEDYSGPVLFEGQAAAQLAFELLGDALSGTPPPEGNDDMESPLSRKLGKHVLPNGFTVVDDPSLTTYAGAPLLGHYVIDDEGIAAQRVLLVDDGRLKTFLMSRTPREGVALSNGHGRSGLVGWGHARPANLIVSTKHGLTKSDLRARLLRAVRDDNGDYGVVVTQLQTRTNATNGDVIPAPEVAYRVDLDGHETLLRGATLASLSVRDLRDIVAAGRDAAVYSFVAESDNGLDLPASIASPALLLDDVEIRGPTAPNKRPPVVPRPSIDPVTKKP